MLPPAVFALLDVKYVSEIIVYVPLMYTDPASSSALLFTKLE